MIDMRGLLKSTRIVLIKKQNLEVVPVKYQILSSSLHSSICDIVRVYVKVTPHLSVRAPWENTKVTSSEHCAIQRTVIDSTFSNVFHCTAVFDFEK